MTQYFTSTPLTGALGARITGIDLSRPLDEGARRALDDAFHQYLVLTFPEQQLAPPELLSLTRQLGGVGCTPYLTGMQDFPDVVPVVKEADERSPLTFGASWHTDFSFQKLPPSRTILYGLDTPEAGGDTLFCNLYLAFKTLSPGMQKLLEGMTAVHSAIRSYGPDASLSEHMENMVINNDRKKPDEMEHPVVRVHPVTGWKALWINPVYTLRFKDMSQSESAPLLDYLNKHAVNPSFTCRVRWQPGTLTMWDNRCTQHCATSDYRGERREMWRTTVAGDQPQGVQSRPGQPALAGQQ